MLNTLFVKISVFRFDNSFFKQTQYRTCVVVMVFVRARVIFSFFSSSVSTLSPLRYNLFVFVSNVQYTVQNDNRLNQKIAKRLSRVCGEQIQNKWSCSTTIKTFIKLVYTYLFPIVNVVCSIRIPVCFRMETRVFVTVCGRHCSQTRATCDKNKIKKERGR